MATKPKVFISYSTKDRPTAEALYTDLQKAGADVFEFERTATPGSSAWDEVLGWIEASDVFIMLVSKSALKSRPVKAEVEHAHYQFLNSTPTRPGKLIPAMLETDVQPPRLLQRFTGLALYNYAAGVKQLIAELGLEVAPRPVDTAREKPVFPTPESPKAGASSGGPKRAKVSTAREKPVFLTPESPTAGASSGGQKRAKVSGLAGSPQISPRSGAADWSRLPIRGMSSAQSSQAQPLAHSQRLGLPRGEALTVTPIRYPGSYLAVIGIIALIGAVVGLGVSSVLPGIASGVLESVAETIRSWSNSLSWLPLISALVICLILSVNAWVTTANGIPVDRYDYTINSAKSLLAALLLASIWILLFSRTVTQTVLTIFTLACVLTTMVTVAVYAVLDEWS